MIATICKHQTDNNHPLYCAPCLVASSIMCKECYDLITPGHCLYFNERAKDVIGPYCLLCGIYHFKSEYSKYIPLPNGYVSIIPTDHVVVCKTTDLNDPTKKLPETTHYINTDLTTEIPQYSQDETQPAILPLIKRYLDQFGIVSTYVSAFNSYIYIHNSKQLTVIFYDGNTESDVGEIHLDIGPYSYPLAPNDPKSFERILELIKANN